MIQYFALPAIELIRQKPATGLGQRERHPGKKRYAAGPAAGRFHFWQQWNRPGPRMARPLGAYFHVPHGLANAICLPRVMEFTWVATPEKFALIAKAMGEEVSQLSTVEGAWKAVEAVKKLCQDIQIPNSAAWESSGKNTRRSWFRWPRTAWPPEPPGKPRVPTEKEMSNLFNLVIRLIIAR